MAAVVVAVAVVVVAIEVVVVVVETIVVVTGKAVLTDEELEVGCTDEMEVVVTGTKVVTS